MFDNPFDSFHNAVAEAKEEREQLDRLLTISTPRERLLVVAIAVTIAAFAVWLFLGQVTPSVSISGTLSLTDEGAHSPNITTHSNVLAESDWLTREEARRISAGLTAVVEVTTRENETITLNGEVSRIDTARVQQESQSSDTNAELGLYRVVFMSNEKIDTAVIGGRNCRIVIELNPQSPISLFGLRRS